MDIETHVDLFNANILSGLGNGIPKPKQTPKKQFITGEIWEMRRRKLQKKQALTEVRRRWRREILLAFELWFLANPFSSPGTVFGIMTLGFFAVEFELIVHFIVLLNIYVDVYVKPNMVRFAVFSKPCHPMLQPSPCFMKSSR